VNLDTKFQLIEAEFGLKGFAVIVRILQNIYGGEGYYCEWNEEVALLFSAQNREGYSVVSEIVTAAIRRGIFSKECFEKYGILTSAGIQKRYLNATKRRVKVNLIKEYLLISCTQFSENVCINSKNVCRTAENVDTFKQSRVEESRVEESRGGNARVPARAAAAYGIHSNVFLEEYEYAHLLEELGSERTLKDYINRLSGWLKSGKPTPLGNASAAISKWWNIDKERAEQTETAAKKGDEFVSRELSKEELKKMCDYLDKQEI
jgi:hypothetical protein